jgi:glycosyltransferase A (GT-A) superfamily protein (DUF2064 family)
MLYPGVAETDDTTRRVLETIEQVLVDLNAEREPGPGHTSLIAAIEDDRAFVIAAQVTGQALRRPPARVSRPPAPI